MNGNASRFVFGSSLIWAAFCVGLYLLNLAIRLEIQPNTDPEITLLYFVYPAAAVLTGMVCRTNSLELWTALTTSALVFLTASFFWHEGAALSWVPAYLLLTLAGYALFNTTRRL